MSYQTSARFTAILCQPRRLTDRIWKSASTELLQLMENARKGLILKKKNTALLAFFKTFYSTYKQDHGDERPAFNFADLQEVPSVERALKDMSTQTLPEKILFELKQELSVILERRPRNLRSECFAFVNKEREDLGMLAFDSICTQGEDDPRPSSSSIPTTDCPLLAASTVFTVHLHQNALGTSIARCHKSFDRAIYEYSFEPYPESAQSRRQLLPWRLPQYERDFAKDAEEVLKALGLPLNVTIAHMQEIASKFRCRAPSCDTALYYPTWDRWVDHQALHRTRGTNANFQFINSDS